MSDGCIRLLIADDHPLIREGISAIVSQAHDIRLIGEAENGLQAVERFRSLRPHVLLLDLQMPVLDGCSVIEQIIEEFPDAKIVVLTTYSRDAQALRALRAGASGYVVKSDLHGEVIQAIRAVYDGGRHVSEDIVTALLHQRGQQQLTQRERSVLTLAATGQSNKRIAAALELSEETVKGYMKIILGKLDATDRTHAVTIALRRGIIEL